MATVFNLREGVTIRGIGPFDLGRLARLHRSCFEDAWSRTDLAHLLSMPGGFGLMARVHDRGLAGLDGLRGVGFALCRIVGSEAELLSIGVAPAYRGRDAATHLMSACLARCRKSGVKAMFLEVAVDNEPAQRLYGRFGFAEVGRRDGYYQRRDGTRVSAFTLRGDLATIAASFVEAEAEARA
jgi:ribosomal-protein-alanine N-acetyltransferase